jgi:hypothetical protein
MHTLPISHLVPGDDTHIQAIIRGKHGREGKVLYCDGVTAVYVLDGCSA